MWFGAVRVLCGTLLCSSVQCGMPWYGTMWFGMLKYMYMYAKVHCGTLRFTYVQYTCNSECRIGVVLVLLWCCTIAVRCANF